MIDPSIQGYVLSAKCLGLLGGGGRGGGQGKTLEIFVNVRQLRQKVEIERISSTFREGHTISTSVLISLTRDFFH